VSASKRRCWFLTAAAVVALAATGGSAQALVAKPHLAVHSLASPVTGGNGTVEVLSVADGGNFALVRSTATDLVSGFADHNGAVNDDLYRVDLRTGQLALVSVSVAGGVNGGNHDSSRGAISPDGRYVAFTSSATDLVSGFVDHNGVAGDAYLRNMDTGQVTLLTHAAGSAVDGGDDRTELIEQAGSDGRYLLLFSKATDLVAGQTDSAGTVDGFRYDRTTGSMVLVTATAAGPAAAGGFYSLFPSPDGLHATFSSGNTGYVPGFTDNNGTGGLDVYERDIEGGTTGLISGANGSATAGANGTCEIGPSSADGRLVGFNCDGTNLVPGFVDHNGTDTDSYLRDTAGSTNVLVSGASGSTTDGGNGESDLFHMSDDGGVVLLDSKATDLMAGFVDGNGTFDLFRRVLVSGATQLVSASSAGPTHGANGRSQTDSLSPDGATVLFHSAATDAVPGYSGPAGTYQAYRWDAASGASTLLSGIGATGGDGESFGTGSRDLSTILFTSKADNLVPGFVDANGAAGSDAYNWFGAAPTAVARATTTAPLTASFDGSGSSDPDGEVASYSWSFGDGQGGTGIAPVHTYAAPGSYAGSLTVTDDSGNTAVAPVTVTVAAAPGPTPPLARRHVALTLGGRRTQRLRKGAIKVTAKCATTCRLHTSGSVSGPYKLKPPRATTARANRRVTLTLRVPRRRLARLRNALRHHRRVVASVTVRATSPGLAAATAKRRVKLRR
jgi:TolB protein